MTQEQFQQFATTQIPIAWIAGVRLENYSENEVQISVSLDFLNQNPFKSMFWAVEGMAAEFSGGMMLLEKIMKSQTAISTLVVKNEATFSKKAVGKIIFTCSDGEKIDAAIEQTINTGEGVLLDLTSIGTDEAGDEVARFQFIWSIKKKS